MIKNKMVKDNGGASLVMVILAMLFVGIIASIVLTITVGNAKSTKATMNSSENFYSSESALDDLSMYLKKLATSSATDAYAATLEKVGVETDIAGWFKNKFKENLNDNLTSLVDHGVYYTGDGTQFLENNITFGREGSISINFGSEITTDSDNNLVLKNVVITLLDEGYESSITTDITFKVQMPATGWKDESTTFTTPIDHFLIISDGNIGPVSGYLRGTYTGSIFAKGDFNIKTEDRFDYDHPTANKTEKLVLATNQLLIGGNINIEKGLVYIKPINDVDKKIVYKAGHKKNAEVWCNSIKIGDADVLTDKAADPDGTSEYLNTRLYLRKNLELNGYDSSVKANGGELYGYSSYPKGGESPVVGTVLDSEPVSSAIILNGLGAKLDLSGLDKLQVAGTAYTALSDIDGVHDVMNPSETTTGISYYSQGESVTYRALQPLYLVPGEFIAGVGHNPMKDTEFNASAIRSNMNLSDEMKNLLNSGYFTSKVVRYVGSTTYVYLFWDFKDIPSAIAYLNQVVGSEKRYDDLYKKQAGILGLRGGYIKLPDNSNTYFKGTAITYETSVGQSTKSKTTPTGGFEDKSTKYNGLIKALDESESIPANNSVYEFLESQLDMDLAANSYDSENVYPGLKGPLEPATDEDGHVITYQEYAQRRRYRLITGENITLASLDAGVTYILITPGNVTITATDEVNGFRGMIIAGGNVSLPKGLKMECMGNMTLTPVGHEENRITTTEFKALLNVVVNDTLATNPNTRLRKIFRIADTSGHAGNGNGDDFVTLEFGGWKRN